VCYSDICSLCIRLLTVKVLELSPYLFIIRHTMANENCVIFCCLCILHFYRNHLSNIYVLHGITHTYVNEALNGSSCIDYFLSSSPDALKFFYVTDEGSNLSDHLPVVVDCMCRVSHQSYTAFNRSQRNTEPDKLEKYLRWDHADIL